MIFEQPVWWLAALPAIAWVAWLHSCQRRRVVVASLLGWMAASGPLEADTRRLRPVPSRALAVQVLAILLAVGGLAGPRLAVSGGGDRVVVVVGVADPLAVRASIRSAAPSWSRDARVTLLDARGRVAPVFADVPVERVDSVLGATLVRDEAAPRWGDAAALIASMADDRIEVLVVAPPDAVAAASDRVRAQLPVGVVVRVHAGGALGPVLGILGAAVEPRALGGYRAVVRLRARALGLGEVAVDVRQGDRVLGTTTVRELGLGDVRAIVALDTIDGTPIEFRARASVSGETLASVWRTSPAAQREGGARTLVVGPSWPRLDAFLTAAGARVERSDVVPADVSGFDLVVLDGVEAQAPLGTHSVWFGVAPSGTDGSVASGPWSVVFGSHEVFMPIASVQEVDVGSVLSLPRLAGADVLAWADALPVVQARAIDGHAQLVFGFVERTGSWTEADAPYVILGRLLRWLDPAFGGTTCSVGVPCPLPAIGGIGAWNVQNPDGEVVRAGAAWTEGASAVAFDAWFVPRAGGWHELLGPSGARRLWVDPAVAEAYEERGSGALDAGDASRPAPAWFAWPWFRALAVGALVASLLAAWGRDRGLRLLRGTVGRRAAVVAAFIAVALASVLALTEGPWPRGWSEIRTVVVEAFVPEGAEWGPLYQVWSASLPVQGVRYDVALGAPGHVLDEDASAADSVNVGAPSGAIAGLEWAAALLADAGLGQVVFPSSGLETTPELGRVLERLAERGALSVVQLPRYAASDEVVVHGSWVLGTAGAGGTARVVFQIEAAAARRVALEVLRDGQLWFESTTDFPAGRSTLTFDVPTPTAEDARYELRLATPEGTEAGAGWAGAVVPAASPGRVAVVSAEVAWPLLFVQLLEVQGFDVALMDPANAPVTASGWTSYDTVVLFDLPAIALVTRQQAALEAWVAEFGGGLVILGGERAFGPGGYHLTALDALSPLTSEIPMDRPDVAVVFVLDRSGSMLQAVGGSNRLEIAREATWAAVQLLDPRSMMGIVVFDSASTLIHPLRAVEDLGGVRRSLDLLTAGGGTNLQPALEQAHLALLGAGDVQKHMIVMTDGLTQGADFDPVLEALVADDVTVSTIAVGQGAAYPRLEQIARLTGGVFYESIDFELLPSIMAQEVLLLTADAVRRDPSQVFFDASDAPFLEGLTTTWPSVGGLVRTTARPEATVHASLSDGEPLLASWRFGTGRVVAWSSEAVGTWTLAWFGEPDFPRLWGQIVRWAGAFAQRPGLRAGAVPVGERLLLEVHAADALGNPLVGRQLTADWVGTDARGAALMRAVDLVEVEPGVYRAHAEGFVGPAIATIRGDDADGLDATSAVTHVPVAAAWAGPPGSLAALATSVGATYGDVGSVELARSARVWSNSLAPAWRPWLVVALVAWLASLTLRYLPLRSFAREPG